MGVFMIQQVAAVTLVRASPAVRTNTIIWWFILDSWRDVNGSAVLWCSQ